ncbi:MAG: regulator of ime2 [Sporothrix thermara]
MIRPATPLTVMLFAAFALLLVSVLSTPLIKGIPLGSFEGYNFGVFGFCRPDGSCSDFELGYDTSSLFTSSESATFDLPVSTRTTLSTILVLHPVAAFLTLVMLIMAISAHFHAASHSIRYLLFVFIISIFTFLAALLAFLIDVLLFVPHMAWGTYIVLAAVILIGLSSIVACAMRRTLVGRKSRQRRIAANAEMSGENFYNRQAQTTAAVTAANANSTTAESEATLARQPTMPQLGAPGSNVGSFEKKDDNSSDEQIPLTSQSSLAPNRYSQQRNQYGGNNSEVMMSGAGGAELPPNGPARRDAYGNPLPYNDNASPPPPQEYGMRQAPPVERMNNMSSGQRGRGGGPGFRGGRGGAPGPYGPQGRGGYGGYGPPPGGRGGYGPPPGRGGYGGPPPNGRGRGGYGGRGGYPGPGPGPGRGRTPPPGYRYDQAGPYGGDGMRGSPGPAGYYGNAPGPNMNAGGMGGMGGMGDMGGMGGSGYDSNRNETSESGDLPRAESPPPLPASMTGIAISGSPLGQAIEMDATTPQPQPQPQQQSQHQQAGRFVEGDDDIAGMVSLQQGRTSRIGIAETSQYVPPRAAWQAQNGGASTNSPIRGPAELSNPNNQYRPNRAPDAYIEDVDPRFAEPVNSRTPPGFRNLPPLAVAPNNASYDDIPQGSRSPAESERSNFTSISQRGINPRWNPPPPNLMPGFGGQGQMAPRRPPVRDTNETLLNSNPDFMLPSANRRPGRPPGPGSGNASSSGGMVPSSAYPPM